MPCQVILVWVCLSVGSFSLSRSRWFLPRKAELEKSSWLNYILSMTSTGPFYQQTTPVHFSLFDTKIFAVLAGTQLPQYPLSNPNLILSVGLFPLRSLQYFGINSPLPSLIK